MNCVADDIDARWQIEAPPDMLTVLTPFSAIVIDQNTRKCGNQSAHQSLLNRPALSLAMRNRFIPPCPIL